MRRRRNLVVRSHNDVTNISRPQRHHIDAPDMTHAVIHDTVTF
jgi:hypothetical protein